MPQKIYINDRAAMTALLNEVEGDGACRRVSPLDVSKGAIWADGVLVKLGFYLPELPENLWVLIDPAKNVLPTNYVRPPREPEYETYEEYVSRTTVRKTVVVIQRDSRGWFVREAFRDRANFPSHPRTADIHIHFPAEVEEEVTQRGDPDFLRHFNVWFT